MAKSARTATAAPPTLWRRLRWQRLSNYLFVMPAALFLLAFMIYPVLFNIQISLYDMKAINLVCGDAPFVGLDNYRAVLTDPVFLDAARHSVAFTIGSILFQVGIGLALALFYNRPFPGSHLMRGLYLIAWTIPVVVTGAIFRWLLDGQFGVINWVLRTIGVMNEPIFWLSEPAYALGAVMFVNIWLGVPFNMVLLLADLQAIPHELYEAASIDGATRLSKLWYVTLPLLRPALLAVLLLGLIYTFRIFDLIWIMTRGGPVNATQVLPTLAYKLVFEQFIFGRGAAVLNLVFIILFVLSLGYLRVIRSEEAA